MGTSPESVGLVPTAQPCRESTKSMSERIDATAAPGRVSAVHVAPAFAVWRIADSWGDRSLRKETAQPTLALVKAIAETCPSANVKGRAPQFCPPSAVESRTLGTASKPPR